VSSRRPPTPKCCFWDAAWGLQEIPPHLSRYGGAGRGATVEVEVEAGGVMEGRWGGDGGGEVGRWWEVGRWGKWAQSPLPSGGEGVAV
jgi:hypothetical protein